jgi:putative hydrolases of HD superfamily
MSDRADYESWRNFRTSGELFDLFEFAEFLNHFRVIERVIWYEGKNTPERNGEHAFQLALFAWFANQRLKLGLSSNSLVFYALVHDLWEVYAGDTPAFQDLRKETQFRHADKEQREVAAFERIKQEWQTRFPEMVERMQAYWDQSDEESRFVRALEKLLAMINVATEHQACRTWRILAITLEEVDVYNRTRAAIHPAVVPLYDELFNLLCAWRTKHPVLFWSGQRIR